MKSRALEILIVAVVACLPVCAQSFPIWRVGRPLPLSSLWDEAQTVVVGSLHNPEMIGSSEVSELPEVVDSRVKRLYWCRGELRVSSVLKGQVSANANSRRYLFARIRPDCAVEQDRHVPVDRQIQIWFLREEGPDWRPVYDAGNYLEVVLIRRSGDVVEKLGKTEIGLRLLDPRSYHEVVVELTGEMFVVAHIACELLGSAKCIKELTDLAVREKSLRMEVCQFLITTYRYDCGLR